MVPVASVSAAAVSDNHLMMHTNIPYGPERKPWEETLSPLATSQGHLLVSPPSEDPATLYDFREEPITSSWYQVPSSAFSKEQCLRAVAETVHAVKISEEDALNIRVLLYL